MSKKTYTTHALVGQRVCGGPKKRHIGKVKHFIFHPSERRVLGFTVKRPDAALMFHRKDVFVPLDDFVIDDGEVVVTGQTYSADKSIEKIIGVPWDECVIWVGMPVKTESDDALGFVDNVQFDAETGNVIQFTTENGVASNVLLGKYKVAAQNIRGFKRGKDALLTHAYESYYDTDASDRGWILVSDDVLGSEMQGGVAVAAGKATAVVVDKAKKGGKKAKTIVDEKAEKAKPRQEKATQKAEDAIQTGAYAIGKQLGKTKGMFSAFKEEFQTAFADDDDDDKKKSD